MSSSTPARRPQGRPCSVCASSQLEAIESALVTSATTFRALARRFSISRDSLRRHVAAHLAPAVRAQIEAASPTPALDLAERIADALSHAAEIRHDADAAGDHRVALAAARTEADLAERLADRFGIATRAALSEIEDATALVRAVFAALAADPALVQPLARELEVAGRTAWACELRKQFSETNREVAA